MRYVSKKVLIQINYYIYIHIHSNRLRIRNPTYLQALSNLVLTLRIKNRFIARYVDKCRLDILINKEFEIQSIYGMRYVSKHVLIQINWYIYITID